MIVNFIDTHGNTLHLHADSFIEAYLKANEQGFDIFDYDIEGEGL